jgi:thymidylate synthase
MKYYHDYTYLDLIQKVLETGHQKGDRTGTGTISTFAQQMRFNLADGTIPMLTTKKMFTRGIIHELLWYLKGETNIQYLLDNGVHIWDEWSSPEGHLNNIYGAQWRRWEKDTWLSSVAEVKLKSDVGTNEPFVTHNTEYQIDHKNKDDLIGVHHLNSEGDEFVVIKKVSPKGAPNSRYLIQFKETKSVTECNRPNLKRGQVRDRYKKTIFGEGCIGEYKEKPKYYNAAYNLWYNMMRRCYDTSIPEYVLYGGSGIFVDQSWRCFSNFIRDIHQLPWFSKWKEEPGEYDLDKDYYGAKCYSKDTCVFLPSRYNQVLPKLDGSKYVGTNKETNKTYEFTVQRWFAEQADIKHSQSISTALQSTGNTGDWYFEKIKPRGGHAFRQQIIIDQIATVINQLRHNPNDRRIIVNAWNVGELDEMALPPCHAMFQFYSRELSIEEREDWFDKNVDVADYDCPISVEAKHEYCDRHNVPHRALSCHLYQRSCDVGLGVPFNIVQYSILTHMIAQVTGHVATEFVWTGGDVHIYNNHIEELKKQLERKPYPSPRLVLNPIVKEIDDFNLIDFEIEEYECHPTIKMDVSV